MSATQPNARSAMHHSEAQSSSEAQSFSDAQSFSKAQSSRVVAWFDPVSGIAGDMALGALFGAGADPEFVIDQLGTLGVDGWQLGVESVRRASITATRAVVDAPQGHHHRHWSDIRAMLMTAPLHPRVQQRALWVFGALADAEGRVHGVPPEDVHFHEVGALDAIVDIVGVCAALESLGVDEVACGPVAVGVGSITAAHGVLPNPPPAVTHLLNGCPIVGVDIEMELTTPTGAAIVAALAESFGAAPAMTVTSTGFGAGTRDLPNRPNITAVLIGHRSEPSDSDATLDEAMAAMQGAAQTQDLVELATNLDDVSGELLGHVLAELVDAGALDAWATPIVMKKGRPAHTLMVLCELGDVTRLADVVARQTGTLGLRARSVVRTALERSTRVIDVDGQQVAVKSGPYRSKAEADDVVAAAKALGRPPIEIARTAEALAARE